jgi:hypothetical protein
LKSAVKRLEHLQSGLTTLTSIFAYFGYFAVKEEDSALQSVRILFLQQDYLSECWRVSTADCVDFTDFFHPCHPQSAVKFLSTEFLRLRLAALCSLR